MHEDLKLSSKKQSFFQSRRSTCIFPAPCQSACNWRIIEEQIFNWTYTDEQRAKHEFQRTNPDKWNPYGALPQMHLFTYQMPDELLAIASAGEFDEFDLTTFFRRGGGRDAVFKHKSDVQKWLDITRSYVPKYVESLKTGSKTLFPYSDTHLPHFYNIHSVSSKVASVAMANLLNEKHNVFWHDYKS